MYILQRTDPKSDLSKTYFTFERLTVVGEVGTSCLKSGGMICTKPNRQENCVNFLVGYWWDNTVPVYRI